MVKSRKRDQQSKWRTEKERLKTTENVRRNNKKRTKESSRLSQIDSIYSVKF